MGWAERFKKESQPMANNNGSEPLAFKPGIPLIGQPFELCGFYLTALLRCHCSPDHPPVVIPEGAAGLCPACHMQYTIVGKQVHPTQGLAIQIGMTKPGRVASDPTQGSTGG